MICPKCKCEYRKGYSVCIDCEVDLVETIGEEGFSNFENKNSSRLSFVPVLSTSNSGDISLIKTILEERWVEYYFEEENFFDQNIKDTFILMVREDLVPSVIELLMDFEVHYLMKEKRILNSEF